MAALSAVPSLPRRGESIEAAHARKLSASLARWQKMRRYYHERRMATYERHAERMVERLEAQLGNGAAL